MKQLALFGIVGAILVLSMGAVYAYSGHDTADEQITVSQMDEMHEQMTQNLDPELKEQMDAQHEEMRQNGFQGCPMMK